MLLAGFGGGLLFGERVKSTPNPESYLQDVEDRGDFEVEYGAYTNPDHAQVEALLKQNQLPEQVVAQLNDLVRLPKDVTIQFLECEEDEANAFWDPATQDILYCYAFITFINNEIVRLAPDLVPPDVQDFEAFVRTLAFNAHKAILFHELGHGLIDLYDIPITGREEDVADQISTWIALHEKEPTTERPDITQGEFTALGGAAAFYAFYQDRETNRITEIDWADTHSFDLARVYNVLCWVYGANPDQRDDLRGEPRNEHDVKLPESRVPWCVQEWDQMKTALNFLLGEAIKA